MNIFFSYLSASLDFSLALMHIAVIFGGAAWYRFFGAGERMAQMDEEGSWQPRIITMLIALILAIWGIYFLANIQVFNALPFQSVVLWSVTAVFLFRGVGGFFAISINKTHSIRFMLVTSAISTAVGITHLLALL